MLAPAFIPPLLAVLHPALLVLGILVFTALVMAAWRSPDIARALAEEDPVELRRVLRETAAGFVVCVAQGFGSGRAPFAPGTFGSVIGMLWFLLLVSSGEFWIYLAGTVFALALSIPVCGAAERILKEHDPSSVVLDEIAAVPVCFLPWVALTWQKLEAMPPVAHFFTSRAWMLTLGIFVLFRAFDALKPWPISKIQNLPGGWGVTADDVLAAVAVALISLLVVR